MKDYDGLTLDALKVSIYATAVELNSCVDDFVNAHECTELCRSCYMHSETSPSELPILRDAQR